MKYIIDLDELADDTAYYVAQCGIPLITCEDCTYWKGTTCLIHNGFQPPKDWHCADAKRRE